MSTQHPHARPHARPAWHATVLLALALAAPTAAAASSHAADGPAGASAVWSAAAVGPGGGVGGAFRRNYRPQGAWGDHGQEASPLFLNGSLYMMQTIMGRVPADGSNGTHSLFCVYDVATGRVVSCPDSSSAFAFCSAVVDRSAPPERLWVFCSAWDRANHTYCHANSSWGCGACADARRGDGDGCFVASWSTEDLRTWHGPSRVLTLPLPHTVPNVGVSTVTAGAFGRGGEGGGVPGHQAFMAIENGDYPLAINTGTDRDLSRNWQLLPFNGSAPRCHTRTACEPGLACPTARYSRRDGYYYVFGGGNDIHITRSRDLLTWEARNMSMATHCIGQALCLRYRRPCGEADTSYEECCGPSPDCSPASGEGRIAPGAWAEYWENHSDCRGGNRGDCRRDFLANMSDWNWSVNDADLTDEGGRAPTHFIYGISEQTAPANASRSGGGGGYHVGTFNGTEEEFLASFFEGASTGAAEGPRGRGA